MKNLLILGLLLTFSSLANASTSQPWCHTNWVGGACGVVTNQDTTGSSAANPYVAIVIKDVPPPSGDGDDEPKDE